MRLCHVSAPALDRQQVEGRLAPPVHGIKVGPVIAHQLPHHLHTHSQDTMRQDFSSETKAFL
jgi:hypothetical protein